MKITMYGTAICPDCVVAKEQLSKIEDVELEYKDITSQTAILKEFLKFRDCEPMFEQVKSDGKIGIPFFILEDGTKTFDIEAYVAFDSSLVHVANACSIDGKNC